MSNGSDPATVLNALDDAEDAFELVGQGPPRFEAEIDVDDDWKTQLTKACRLLEVANVLRGEDGYYTAVIEVCFGAIERSIEAYAIAEAGDELADFQAHEHSYDRAGEIDLFEGETAERLNVLYSDNRIKSYYGGGHPTERQSMAMVDLATAVHEFAVDQIREGGICRCEGSQPRKIQPTLVKTVRRSRSRCVVSRLEADQPCRSTHTKYIKLNINTIIYHPEYLPISVLSEPSTGVADQLSRGTNSPYPGSPVTSPSS